MSIDSKYVIGIDLGTTNSVLAYGRLDGDLPQVEVLPIPQWNDLNERESHPQLPSFLYATTEREREANASLEAWVAGRWARQQSVEQPERTVASAKSWLCHDEVDRQSPILPWGADELEKISPVDASAAYLRRLVEAWNEAFPDSPFHEQWIALTVPASFDITARELTKLAAQQAGFPDSFVMLEEPQAAAYHWIQTMGDGWRKAVQRGDRILVCDIGGGTTDLTLLAVEEEEGSLHLRRLAVGPHLLVGGDNMDLALAHLAASKFEEKGTQLNPWQATSLWHASRAAKESLLGHSPSESHTLSVLGRGTRLIGGTVSIELQRREVESFLVDGFFPACSVLDDPLREADVGFQELGLPYETDSAITRHVAQFLRRELGVQTDSTDDRMPESSSAEDRESTNPDHRPPLRVLFNGGAFRADLFRQRLLGVMQGWTELGVEAMILDGPMELDQAVACGAAYYGWAKHHGGVRVRGGTARSYYVGIETTGLAVPGMKRPLQALCVAPFGMEEGSEADVPGREVGLVVGKPARFRFFASAVRKSDRLGVSLKGIDENELQETSPIEVTLPSGEDDSSRFVSVRFRSRISELGMLELWCYSQRDERAWKLEWNVRQ